MQLTLDLNKNFDQFIIDGQDLEKFKNIFPKLIVFNLFYIDYDEFKLAIEEHFN